MIKFIAHDTINDIALIETNFAFNVRYGLENTAYGLDDLESALQDFKNCQKHALACAEVTVEKLWTKAHYTAEKLPNSLLYWRVAGK